MIDEEEHKKPLFDRVRESAEKRMGKTTYRTKFGSTDLDCDSWFEKDRNGNRQFIPYLCAMDYCHNYEIITGYKSKVPTEFFIDETCVDDATPLIRHRLEVEAKGRITHQDMDDVVECIANISRVTEPEMFGLTAKEFFDKVWKPLNDST